MNSSAAGVSLSVGLLKRKACTAALSRESNHQATLEWLESFLEQGQFKDAVAQLDAAKAGRIDGDVLYSLSKEDMR